jgi:hypothetical protein
MNIIKSALGVLFLPIAIILILFLSIIRQLDK